MKSLALVLLCLFVGFVASPARAAIAAPPAACPAGSPSPDGSRIFPSKAGATSCVLTDRLRYKYKYVGTYLYIDTGQGFRQYGQRNAFEINSGGIAFIGSYCRGTPLPEVPNLFWSATTTSGFETDPWISPTRRLPNEFFNRTTSKSYRTLEAMVGTASSHDRLEVKTLPKGLPLYLMPTQINGVGLTIAFDPGAAVGCRPIYGDAFFQLTGKAKDITISGAEVAYVRDSGSGTFRGINLGRSLNPTLEGVYIHDNDMGVLSSGGNGVTTIANSTFVHNGTPLSNAATHNIYLSWCGNSTCGDVYHLSGIRSYCTGFGGFQLKIRGPNDGTPITRSTFAEPDPTRIDRGRQCQESAAIDLSCGGDFVIGGARRGAGDVIEVGPQLQNTGGILRYGAEAVAGQGRNCPKGPGWAKNSLTIQNSWIIDDHPGPPVPVVYIPADFRGHATCVIKNSKIVGSGARSPLGEGCTDGGGNKFYADRAAAGLKPYPALPPPM